MQQQYFQTFIFLELPFFVSIPRLCLDNLWISFSYSIYTGVWNNWLLVRGGGISPPPPPKRFASHKTKNWWHFIYIKCGQCVGQRKREHQFWLKNVAMTAKQKNAAKTCGEIMGFETTSAKSSYIVLHDMRALDPKS